MIKRIAASINGRFIQPYILNHFENTKHGKQIKSFQAAYKNRRCFIIGNGPSLQIEDLNTLCKNHEVTFAFNRIYKLFDRTTWRPDFYIFQDEKLLAGCKDEVSQLQLAAKFIPIQMEWNYGLKIQNAMYFNLARQPANKPMELSFSMLPAKEIYSANTVIYSAAQLAVYMGFNEIFFIGVDHQFNVMTNDQGELIVDSKIKNHFSEEYTKEGEDLYIPNVDQTTLAFIAIKRYCDLNNIRTYNATRGGKLEVFPRVSFDTLFARGDS